MTDMERVQRLAALSASRWRRHHLHDDIAQEALIHAWLNREITSDATLVWVVQRRIIDALRLWSRDPRTGSTRTRQTVVPLADHDWLTDDPDLDVATLYGLTGRDAAIAEGIANGTPGQDIAANVGVHPSRISQLRHRLKELLA